METKDIIFELRTKKGLSQEELADKIFVTRQAVSRWENGETVPNTETLKLLSRLFDVSINTLLGSPRKLICQCCGMPLEDSVLSRETDGFFNEEYCKFCYADGEYTYENIDDLMKETLPKINYWKRYTSLGGEEKFEEFKKLLMEEINALRIEGMPEVTELNALAGSFVNLEYTLPNGMNVKFLNDNTTYLGCQLESMFGIGCFGVVANMEFILVCTYDENGANPELVLYKKR